MKWHRTDYIEYMTCEAFQRPMFVELFGPLIGLAQEWKSQGATEDEISLTGFDFDTIDTISCGGHTSILASSPAAIIEKTDTYEIGIDVFGRKTKRFTNVATIALPLDYPVSDWDDWEKIKPKFTFLENRIDTKKVDAAKHAQKKGSLVLASIPGGFDLPRQLMGEERVCYAYYDQPELIKDILDTVGDTAYRVLDRISDELVIDNLSVHEDMAGKSGSLIGPAQIERFIKPYYRKVWDMLSEKGTRLFSQDSDGNMNSVIDAFLDCGVNIMYPAEPAAGMDIVALKKKYGTRLAYKGGIDKHVLRSDKNAIERELLYKMQPLMQQGGVAFGLDHRIPNGTPLEHYRFYVETAREILGLPKNSHEKGWVRMAF